MNKDWEIKKLGELSKKKDAVVSGPFGSNLKVSDYKTEGVPILRLQNIGKGYFIDKSIKYITEKKAEELNYHSFKSGDIALAKLGIPIGKTCIIPDNFSFGIITADIVRIRPDLNSVNYKFLEYFLNTDISVAQLTGNISGATRPRVNLSDVRNIEIPIPSIYEQQRIVAILGEAFTAIATAKANAEQNLKNARELFESYLQGVFENKGEGWEEKKLSEITEVKDGTHDSPKYVNEGIPFVTQKNIKQSGLTFDDTKYITKTDHEKFYKRSNVTNGDILISMIGANRGMAAIVNDKRTFSIKNVGLIKKSENIDQNYLLYFLKSPMAMKYVLYMSNGGAQEFVGLTALRSFPIPLPSLDQQQVLVEKLNSLSAETKKLESIYQQKIEDLEELKKSVLHKAFNGELKSPERA